ncbi:MAG: asparagine synthase (glutamine-hydrolyzing) [Elusimicrobiota bacterium]
MCGITGIISLKKDLSGEDTFCLKNMTEVLRHRGPDDTGFFRSSKCAMGNTRLKIIDLSDNANLPMPNEDGKIQIAYNGEVTNFRELKEEYSLENKHRFRSTSDTEVLIHLYEELGIDFVNKLSGQFAFAIFDDIRQKVYVVRDFYGIRPLFYMIKNEKIYFASEIKSFLEIPGFRDAIDIEGIYHYFTLAYIPGRRTPFEDVRELRNCELIETDIRKGTFNIRKYYDIKYTSDTSMNLKETSSKVYELLLDSVRRNMISDVPVGLTFSGGVDTSCILALTKKLGLNREFHTFSIKMNEPSFDESYYQRLMVEHSQPIHHEIEVDPEDVLRELVRHMVYMDEPNGDGAAIPFFILAREAKKHVSVLLSGEGGDEVFNAYETHGAFYLRNYYRKLFPKPVRSIIKTLAKKLPSNYSKLSLDFLMKRFTEGAELGVPESHIFWRHVLAEDEKKMLMPRHSSYDRTDSIFRQEFDRLKFEEDLDKISFLDINYYFIDDLLVKNDRMVMAHSIEARFPFMDRLLLEYVSKIPPDMRIRGFGFNRRYIEKKAMAGILPEEILKRKNMGLEMPHSIWFLDKLGPVIEKYFTRDRISATGILDYNAVIYFRNMHMSGKKDYGRALWCILIYLIWFDLFVYSRDYKKYL